MCGRGGRYLEYTQEDGEVATPFTPIYLCLVVSQFLWWVDLEETVPYTQINECTPQLILNEEFVKWRLEMEMVIIYIIVF